MAIRKRTVVIILIYAVIAMGMLSSSASFDIMQGNDSIDHVAITIQARKALEEGQFPLLVAPYEWDGWRYPLFQFYSQTPYILSGLIYKYLTPSNPYLANLLLLLLALIIGAFFIYRTSFFLTRSLPAAMLAGVTYMAAPYFIINIHARGDFTESIAQGVLPVVLFYVIRCGATRGWIYVLLSGIAWFILATTHIITFVYSSLFIGILILSLGITKQAARRQLARVGIAYGLGVLLALYFLAPAALESTDLFIRNYKVGSPQGSNWLTPLPALLSPVSIPSEPQPGQLTTPYLHPAVGLPMLIAWATVAYYFLLESRKSWPEQLQRTDGFVPPLLGLFCLALFMTWSPFDFWQFLPSFSGIIQFTYRLLTQVMWTGALLSAYALVLIFKTRLDQRHLILGILLIVMATASWLPHPSRPIKFRTVVKQPTLAKSGLAARDYVRKTKPTTLYGNLELFEDDDQEPQFNSEKNISTWSLDEKPVLHLEGVVPAEQVNNSIIISMYINKENFSQIKLLPGAFSWQVPFERIKTNKNNIKLKLITEPLEKEGKLIKLEVSRLNFSGLSQENTAVPVSVMEHTCRQRKIEKICEFSVQAEAQVVQLPMIFYPRLLEVRVNGEKADYLDTPYKGFGLVGLRLKPGNYQVSMVFVGLNWAKYLSGMSWILVMSTLISLAIVKRLKKGKRL